MYILLSDSIAKHVNRCKHTKVQAYPGATVKKIYHKLLRREISVTGMRLICVHLATNDVCDRSLSPTQIKHQLATLFRLLRFLNPGALLFYSAILIRPKDIGNYREAKREETNKQMEKWCRWTGIMFIKSWKAMLNGFNIRPGVYMKDGLHLTYYGAHQLRKCIEGFFKCMEGTNMRLN